MFPSHGATWLDPAIKWKTIETKHFSINYYPEIEDVAIRLAPIAEEVNTTMSKVLKYKLDMKTQVTLIDNTDYGNGSTTVFPYPSIMLYVSDLSDNINPYKYDNYLRYLFLHEYTHALHLDIAEGGVSVLRAIFGRMIFPNAFEPWFMIEGMATYMESRYTNAGRGRDPRWDMMMRMDILDDNIKSIDQAAVNTVLWPDGSLRYLYGVEFLQYLSDTYGEDRLIDLAHVYGEFFFSLGIDAAFTYIYRENLTMLWSDWLEAMKTKYQTQKAKLGDLTVPVILTNSGYSNVKPKWSKDSTYIYYLQRNADAYPQIRRLDPVQKRSDKLLEAMVNDESLSISPDGRTLLFSKADIYKNFYIYKDLYLMDLSSRKVSQLTSGLRAADPGFSPDGQKIVFVRNEKGMRSLWITDLKGRAVRLSTEETDVQYFSPVYSPDGSKLAAAKHDRDGSQKIYLIDPVSGSEEVMYQGDRTSTEANPSFSPAGDYVFFDSDRTGIVDLYAYHLPSGRLFQVTNVIGGAMMPDVSPGGKKLAYVSYSSKGYDIAELDINPAEWKEVQAPATFTMPAVPAIRQDLTLEASSTIGQIHDYNPWPSLMPRFWIPYGYYNENGSQTSIYIGSFDPLEQQMYYLNLGYDFMAGRPSYVLYYTNDQYFPQLTLSLSDIAVNYDWSGTSYWEREMQNLAALSFYDNRVFYEYDKMAFTIGLQNINLTNISSIDTFAVKPSLGNLNALLLAWRYKSDRAYDYSISSEDGLDLSLKVEANLPELKSDYTFTTYSGTLYNYFATFWRHHVLASRLSGFYSRGDQLQQSNFTWQYLPLRGYPSGSLFGNKGAALSLEYRYPLWYTEKGLYYGSTFFDRIWGDLFFDTGGATFGRLDQAGFKRAVGAELNVNTSAVWLQYFFTFKLGYAHGLDAGGQENIYFTITL